MWSDQRRLSMLLLVDIFMSRCGIEKNRHQQHQTSSSVSSPFCYMSNVENFYFIFFNQLGNRENISFIHCLFEVSVIFFSVWLFCILFADIYVLDTRLMFGKKHMKRVSNVSIFRVVSRLLLLQGEFMQKKYVKSISCRGFRLLWYFTHKLTTYFNVQTHVDSLQLPHSWRSIITTSCDHSVDVDSQKKKLKKTAERI